MSVRTRFAPSPTGFMHVGGVRTALFAWLLAEQASGTFILRIEDTDKQREVQGSITQIEHSLKWLGIVWQEGIDKGGEYGPYLQSKRLDIYRTWAYKLVENGRAYADPYTKEELEAFRESAKQSKKAFLYRDHRPERPPTWDGSQPLRFKSDPKSYTWTDAVMGELLTGPEVIDDFIIMKSDGYPTYNFCHIIDDMLMKVTHVLRSQEFISSTPKFLNLYEALNIEPPVLATLPFVMAIDGKKKLGKRDGAKDILDYAAQGYLPEAMMNFLATLGWNDGTEQEVFTKDELVEKFALSRVQRSAARFDEKRLLWLNGQHIRLLSIDDLSRRVEPFWPESAADTHDDYKLKILTLIQDRLKTLADVPTLSEYFFSEPAVNLSLITDNKQLKKLENGSIISILVTASQHLSSLDEWTSEHIQATLNALLEISGEKPVVVFSLIRIATTWAPFSPQLNDTLELLGKKTTLSRLTTAIDALQP